VDNPFLCSLTPFKPEPILLAGIPGKPRGFAFVTFADQASAVAACAASRPPVAGSGDAAVDVEGTVAPLEIDGKQGLGGPLQFVLSLSKEKKGKKRRNYSNPS
jgi:RNA recognition motif-containing protein